MSINLEVSEEERSLQEENLFLRTALEEAFHSTRWYVTVLSLAILTLEDKFIINNNLIHHLEGKEINFDTELIDGREGFVRIKFKKMENDEDVNTISKEERD